MQPSSATRSAHAVVGTPKVQEVNDAHECHRGKVLGTSQARVPSRSARRPCLHPNHVSCRTSGKARCPRPHKTLAHYCALLIDPDTVTIVGYEDETSKNLLGLAMSRARRRRSAPARSAGPRGRTSDGRGCDA